jgi:hypothetical protein
VKLPGFQPKGKPLNSKIRLLTEGRSALASQKPTHFGRETDRFNLFINPKALGLVVCPLATGCPRRRVGFSTPVLKARLLDFFPLLVSGQRLPVGMFD